MILYLISELDVGGAEKSLHHLATRLDPRFGRPTVACLWGRGKVADWLHDAGIEVISLGARRACLPLAALRLRRLLMSGRFRLLHTFLFHANIAGRIAAIGTGVPVVSSLRVTETDRPLRATIDRLTCRRIVAETCVSHAVRRWAIDRGLPAGKLVVIPNGVDVRAYEAPPGRLRSELGLPPNAKIALFVGRLHRQKGPDVLLDAAAKLAPANPDLHFVLAGDGPMRGELQQMAQRSGLAPRVHLLGPREDVPSLLADAALLVVPSRWEGMPNVVLEAMAAGRPVVAVNVGGSAELVIDAGMPGQPSSASSSRPTGMLVPPENPQALAEAILRILSDEAFADQLGAAARERAASQFSIQRMVRLNEQLYNTILLK